MRRDGNVASKPEILDHVWGMDFAGDPNVVEVYIGYLRRKLDEPVRLAPDPHGPRRGLPAHAPSRTDEDPVGD